MKRSLLLVPGWGDRPRSLRHIHRFLLESGYDPDSIHLLDFRRPWGSNIEHAEELAARINRIPGNSPQDLDIVAHSMGGLAIRYLYKAHPEAARRIRRVICLGSPHGGTMVAWLTVGPAGREMRPGSDFLKALGSAAPEGPDFINIRAPFDIRILPGTSSELPGARNYQVVCLGHRDLLRRGTVLRRLKALLDEP